MKAIPLWDGFFVNFNLCYLQNYSLDFAFLYNNDFYICKK